MISQKIREIAPEQDPLRMGMGWKAEDLSKPQIMVESTFGDSHPGSAHLLELVDQAVAGVAEANGKAARYFATDICDGMAQGHDGINYSLASRDTIANMIEIHAGATPFDGGVFVSSCDKAVPAHLMGIGRVNMPSILVTGGVMDAGPDLLTLEQIGMYSAQCARGEISEEKLTWYKQHACPSCGACSFMGTASTMQVMGEALGLMLPGSALMPATCEDLKTVARQAGRQVMELARMGLKPRDMVTMKSFENAIMVHAAISGSTNSLLHIPAIAHEFGLELDAELFDRMHRGAHYLLDIRPAGKWPAQYFYYAGGVPRIMEEIRSMLHLDVMTVTGKTLGENLDDLKANGFYDKCDTYCASVGLLGRISFTRLTTQSARTVQLQSSRVIWLRKAQSSSTPHVRRKCFRQPCMPVRLTARKRRFMLFSHTAFIRAMQCSFGMKVRRVPECRRCSTPRKQFLLTGNWDAALR